jgi:hypothetical protein
MLRVVQKLKCPRPFPPAKPVSDRRSPGHHRPSCRSAGVPAGLGLLAIEGRAPLRGPTEGAVSTRPRTAMVLGSTESRPTGGCPGRDAARPYRIVPTAPCRRLRSAGVPAGLGRPQAREHWAPRTQPPGPFRAHLSLLGAVVSKPHPQPFSLNIAAALTGENPGNVAGGSKTEMHPAAGLIRPRPPARPPPRPRRPARPGPAAATPPAPSSVRCRSPCRWCRGWCCRGCAAG